METGAGSSELSSMKCSNDMPDVHYQWSDDDDAILAAVMDDHSGTHVDKIQDEDSSQLTTDDISHPEDTSIFNDREQDNISTVNNMSVPQDTIANNDIGITKCVNSVTSAGETKMKENENAYRDAKTISPLKLFRPCYLWVSDLTKQHWCEQMLLYTFTVPTIPVENPVMTAGSSLHLARELAVHDVIQVEATSREDTWAIKVLNLLGAVQGFLSGITLAREVPIFGAPFDKDVFLVGLIDELQFDPDSYTIELSELKTRTVRSHPKLSQQEQNKLQVRLYKKLFDDLVKGKLPKETISKHLKLKLDKPLGEGVIGQLDAKFVTGKNLGELLDFVLARVQALTCISRLSIEYVLQDTHECVCQIPVDYDDVELKATFEHYINFWHRERDVEGVEIEDAWKCQKCDFADICEWRERKAQEHSAKNMKKLTCS